MKKGEAFASKYNSQQLKIRVPNVVMVFSNYPPSCSELAKLRLRVFYIEDNQLRVRTKDQKKKKDKVNTDSDSDFDSQISDFDYV